MRIPCLGLAAALALLPAPARGQSPTLPALRDSLEQAILASGAEISVAYRDLGNGDTLYIDADRRYHAASTMKVPVLIELARRVDAGDFAWEDSIPVVNRFASIVDGSPYSLGPADDSDSLMYALVDRKVSLRFLAEHMIRWSSNLATNVLIELLDPKRVDATAHEFGADSIQVLRGVEDIKAYEQGLSNTTTARDLNALFTAIADARAASPQSTDVMIAILTGQEFNDGIPAGLPPGTRVAHKTGSITRIAHDAGIVYPQDGSPWVLTVLTRGFDELVDGEAWIARVAGVVERWREKNGE
jgi:beta-lactamase class A